MLESCPFCMVLYRQRSNDDHFRIIQTKVTDYGKKDSYNERKGNSSKKKTGKSKIL